LVSPNGKGYGRYRLAMPFHDSIAESIEEYESFLKSLGYSPIADADFGKKI
jgi:hypothetical protein